MVPLTPGLPEKSGHCYRKLNFDQLCQHPRCKNRAGAVCSLASGSPPDPSFLPHLPRDSGLGEGRNLLRSSGAAAVLHDGWNHPRELENLLSTLPLILSAWILHENYASVTAWNGRHLEVQNSYRNMYNMETPNLLLWTLCPFPFCISTVDILWRSVMESNLSIHPCYLLWGHSL